MTPMDNKDWEVESDMNVLMSAERIKADPDRLARAKEHARLKAMEMSEMAGAKPKDGDVLAPGLRRIKA